MYTFSEITDDRTSLDLEWDALRVSVPIQVNTTQQVQAAINGLDTTWRSYANAARYMLETKKDYDAGLKYIDQALALKDDWYSMWVKGALLAAKGDFGSAHDWAEKAHTLALQVGNVGGLEPRAQQVDRGLGPQERPLRSARRRRPSSASGPATGPAIGSRRSPTSRPRRRPSATATAAMSPPGFKPASDTLTAPGGPPDGDPPAMRRGRLRHR